MHLPKRPTLLRYGVNFYAALMMLMGDSVDPITQASPARELPSPLSCGSLLSLFSPQHASSIAQPEIAFASIVVLIGACMNATIFANVATYVAQISAHTAKHKLKMDTVMRAMRFLKLEPDAKDRIRAYFDYCWARHNDFDPHTLLGASSELPVYMRKAVCLKVHEAKLRVCPLFSEVEAQFIATLATHLTPAVFLPAESTPASRTDTRCSVTSLLIWLAGTSSSPATSRTRPSSCSAAA